jgi:RNA polymerase sigma-70 factor (ECF subfamily)
MQGYSVAETAEMLGVAEGTVKSRCSRARAKLAEALGDGAAAASPPVRGPGPRALRHGPVTHDRGTSRQRGGPQGVRRATGGPGTHRTGRA